MTKWATEVMGSDLPGKRNEALNGMKRCSADACPELKLVGQERENFGV